MKGNPFWEVDERIFYVQQCQSLLLVDIAFIELGYGFSDRVYHRLVSVSLCSCEALVNLTRKSRPLKFAKNS